MVVACLALLVALGGTGMAAVTQLARNSVGTPQLKDGAVTNPKIRNNAINSAKVAARSLLRSDFAPGQLPAGPVGPQGPAGPAGAAGPQAPPAGRRHRCDHGRTASVVVDGGTAENGAYNSSARSRRSAAATSGRSRAERRLERRQRRAASSMTQRARARSNAQNQVIGFLAVGRNDSGKIEHVHCARSLLHAVALVALSSAKSVTRS